MAKIVWVDLDGKRHESEEFDNIKSFRSYIKENIYVIKIVELLDCNPLDSLYDESTRHGLFENCPNLVEVKDVIGTSEVENMDNMFRGCEYLKKVPYFDTSNVRSMSCMFQGCSGLGSVPYFDTSNVEDMEDMFERCSGLKVVPLLDISNATHTIGMFYGCKNLRSYTLPCDEYSTRSMAVKAYNGKKMLDMWDELFE